MLRIAIYLCDHLEAYFPLAFVDHRFADGMIRGFAVAIPKDVNGEERRIALRALACLKKVWFNRSSEWTVKRVDDEDAMESLKSRFYERLSRSWATVTPMVFDQFPKDRPARRLGDHLPACLRIGLPDPIAVEVSHVSASGACPPALNSSLFSSRVSPHVRMPTCPSCSIGRYAVRSSSARDAIKDSDSSGPRKLPLACRSGRRHNDPR